MDYREDPPKNEHSQQFLDTWVTEYLHQILVKAHVEMLIEEVYANNTFPYPTEKLDEYFRMLDYSDIDRGQLRFIIKNSGIDFS